MNTEHHRGVVVAPYGAGMGVGGAPPIRPSAHPPHHRIRKGTAAVMTMPYSGSILTPPPVGIYGYALAGNNAPQVPIQVFYFFKPLHPDYQGYINAYGALDSLSHILQSVQYLTSTGIIHLSIFNTMSGRMSFRF